MRALPVQNCSLLLKLVHRLHSQQDSSWARWVWSELGCYLLTPTAASALPGPHWSSLAGLMPVYRAITTVRVGDGRTTAFWLDAWLPGGALSLRMASLFSHTTMPDVSVAHVLRCGIDGVLVPLLNHAGVRDHALLLPIIEGVVVTEAPELPKLREGRAPLVRRRVPAVPLWWRAGAFRGVRLAELCPESGLLLRLASGAS